MSELTSALLGIGLTLIALVAIFNWWQERKIKKTINQHASKIHEDLLMDTQEILISETIAQSQD